MVRSRIISRIRNFVLSRINAGEPGGSGGEGALAVLWTDGDDMFWSDGTLVEWTNT